MIKIFRKFRQQMLIENKFSKYLVYALGEVVLVVVGIFIALQLNNANEIRKNNKSLEDNLEVLVVDIENDLQDIKRVKKHFSELKPYYVSILTDSITKEEFINSRRSATLLTYMPDWKIESNGIELIKGNKVNKDSLINNFISIHNFYSELINEQGSNLANNNYDNIKYYQNNFSWFPLFINDFSPEGHHTIVNESLYNNQDYKNKLAYRYIIVYGNYVVFIEKFEIELIKNLAQIKKRLNK